MSKYDSAVTLDHIPEGHLDDAAFENHCVDVSIGPVKLEACVDISVPSASVAAYLLGVRLGGCTVSPTNQCCTVGGSVDGFKAEVTFCLKGTCITYKIDLKTPFGGKTFSGNVYCWS